MPTVAVLAGILVNGRQLESLRSELTAKIDSLKSTMDSRFSALENTMDARFEAAHQQLLRVEGVMYARLQHLEEHR